MPSNELDDAHRARIERLRWHCRRALLELDIVFQRFWHDGGRELDEATMNALEKLLELEDHDLWEIISGRRNNEDPQLQGLLARLQSTEPRPT